jgi:endonuclease YncB( thermonuclease family)
MSKSNVDFDDTDDRSFPIREVVEVESVTDGDTVKLKDGRRVRLFGVDAPELHPEQRYGFKAFEFAKAFVAKNGGVVTIVAPNGSKNIDKYGRSIRLIYGVNGAGEDARAVKGRSLNEQLLTNGLAWSYDAYLKGTDHADEFAELMRGAKGSRRGLWEDLGSQTAPLSPWDFRREQKKLSSFKKKSLESRKRNETRARRRRSPASEDFSKGASPPSTRARRQGDGDAK